ncbi:hypothetical protein NMG60_11030920 [Bertholletia excelsa]
MLQVSCGLASCFLLLKSVRECVLVIIKMNTRVHFSFSFVASYYEVNDYLGSCHRGIKFSSVKNCHCFACQFSCLRVQISYLNEVNVLDLNSLAGHLGPGSLKKN